jgi:hypothetical protein
MFVVRMLVTLAILVPFFVLQPDRPIWQTFVIAFVAFGAGHLVEYAIKRARRGGGGSNDHRGTP